MSKREGQQRARFIGVVSAIALEELLEKTGDKFNESANCDKPRQLHNLGEEVRLTRLAFKENGFKIPDL
jgi:hypothetical protein